MTIPSGRVVMSHFRIIFLFRRVFALFFFLFCFGFLWFNIFLQRVHRLSKPLRCFLKIFFIFEVAITNKLLFRQFDNFLFIHASSMQSFRASDTLEDRHRISADTAYIAVVKGTAEVEWVCIYILKEFLDIVLFDTLWMEILRAVGSWAFSNLILLFIILIGLLFGLLFFIVFLPLTFFILLILCPEVKSLFFTDETGDQIILTVITCPRCIDHILDNFIIQR